jgi:hypothetical protein
VHALQLATALGSNTQKRPSSSRQASLLRPRQAQLGGSGQVVGIGRHAVVVVDGGEEPGLIEQYWVTPHAQRSAMSKGRYALPQLASAIATMVVAKKGMVRGRTLG